MLSQAHLYAAHRRLRFMKRSEMAHDKNAKTREPDVSSSGGELKSWADTDTVHGEFEDRHAWEVARDRQVDAQRAQRVADDKDYRDAHVQSGQNSDTLNSAPVADNPQHDGQPVPYRNRWQPSQDTTEGSSADPIHDEPLEENRTRKIVAVTASEHPADQPDPDDQTSHNTAADKRETGSPTT